MPGGAGPEVGTADDWLAAGLRKQGWHDAAKVEDWLRQNEWLGSGESVEGLGGWLSEIHERGFVIIPDFISQAGVAKIRHAFDTEVKVMPLGTGVHSKTPGKTIRGHNLLAKTRAVDHVFFDPRLRGIVKSVLGEMGQVNICTQFNVLPGEGRQNLHQDDGLWPIRRPHAHFLCNAVVAIDDFDVENGATHLVPYSHRWTRPVDQKVKTLQVTMKSGSLLMWAGGMWHAGGANVSRHRERQALFMSHNLSFLRQQENQFIGVPREVARKMPLKMQRLLGYRRGIWSVDFRDSAEVLQDGHVVNPAAKIAYPGFGKPESWARPKL